MSRPVVAQGTGSGSMGDATTSGSLVALAIEPHRVLSCEPFPAPESDLDVQGVDLHRVTAGASPLGGDERRP